MPEFFGLCGRFTPTTCLLSWTSKYANKVGVYPNQLLPSRRTIWHATSDAGFNFSVPIVAPGETFGIPFGGGLGIFQGFGPPQSDVFVPQTHHILIFARTANRLNVPYIVTQSDFDSKKEGIALIDVGEFIFEAIGVTDQVQTIEQKLTDEELEEIKGTGEAASDKAFRKLFGQIPDNLSRFKGIKINKLGIEYRLDNGGPKINGATELAGIGDLRNPSYRDASSRLLKVDLDKVVTKIPIKPGEPVPPPGSLQAEARAAKVGDTIFLTYVAVKDHYIRQSIEASWLIQSISVPPEAFGSASQLKGASYRFYEWNIKNDDPQGLPIKVAGWRVVESYNIGSNFIAPVGAVDTDPELGQFIFNASNGINMVNILDVSAGTQTVGGSTQSEILEFIDNRIGASKSTQYNVNLNRTFLGAGAGNGSNHRYQVDQSFKNAFWYLNRNFRTSFTYPEAKQHVFYNVHSKALQKRDVDKFGINRFLAVGVESDIIKGKNTFFPFMDDPEVNNPTTGISKYLDSSNTRFEPIEPISTMTVANLEIEAGVAGAITLGPTGSTDDIVAVFDVNSNIITERFEEDTRVLVERHFTIGERGLRTVAIEGAAAPRSSITCIGDPARLYSFVAHLNDDNFIVFNNFQTTWFDFGFSNLKYRPDLGSPPILSNDNPTPDQFEEFVGYDGMLGGHFGYQPGKTISISIFADLASFEFKTTSKDIVLRKIPNIDNDNIEEITFQTDGDKVIVPIGAGYSGRTDFEYTYSGESITALLLFKNGSRLEGVIDGLTIGTGTNLILSISHHWMKGDTIELVGNGLSEVNITNITVKKIKSNKAVDILDDATSSKQSDKNAISKGELYTRSLFFETDIISMGEDNNSRVFIFMNDKNGGISCVQSNDFGFQWYFHYGIIEPIDQEEAQHPFVVNASGQNMCFLFYLFMNKILCRSINYELFQFEDAMLIERFVQDRLVIPENKDELIKEKRGLYSTKGRELRRGTVSHPAAGKLTDLKFREISGTDPDTFASISFEERIIEKEDGTSRIEKVRKNPIDIGPNTAFTNQDIEDIHFSAYRTDSGHMKLFFLAESKAEIGGGNQLQCHFSLDDGQNWYDYWEWIENSFNRIRADNVKHIQWIDRDASGDPPPSEDIIAASPDTDQQAFFGINVHWSRLKRHKIGAREGDLALDSESQVLDIESPYVFYQPSVKKVFLFYIYEGCLLCKIFSDKIFSNTQFGFSNIKTILERQTRSFFVDGDLSNDELREEIHYYTNTETNERMIEGNIIFTHQFGIDVFDQTRNISAQRVCATELTHGEVRVFYKHENSKQIRAALYTGSEWFVEDLMRNIELDDPVIVQINEATITNVCGGFSGTNFACGDVGKSGGG